MRREEEERGEGRGEGRRGEGRREGRVGDWRRKRRRGMRGDEMKGRREEGCIISIIICDNNEREGEGRGVEERGGMLYYTMNR